MTRNQIVVLGAYAAFSVLGALGANEAYSRGREDGYNEYHPCFPVVASDQRSAFTHDFNVIAWCEFPIAEVRNGEILFPSLDTWPTFPPYRQRGKAGEHDVPEEHFAH